MLKILKVITGNLTSERATVPLPQSVPTPDLFRGPVQMNTSKCIGCGMCSYVCVSNAIVGENQEKAYAWSYEPGRCTFCGRCFERCPVHAISMDAAPLEPYGHPGERSVQHVVEFGHCPECGEPVRAAHEELLKRAFADLTEETRELVRLCERCRRRHLQRNMMVSAFGEREKNR
jgi:formate hydrogenlyase subunit 6